MRVRISQALLAMLLTAAMLPVQPSISDAQERAPAMEFLQRFGRGRRVAPPQEQSPDPPAENPRAAGAKDYIDARAPRDLPAEALWETARTAIGGGDWKRGVEWLQKLLDMPGDALIRTGPDRWESLRVVAQGRLNAAPREVRADYERQYGGLAQQMLNEARRSGATERLVEVATRFLHTRPGAEAANILAAWHLDRQEFTLALRWLRDLEAAGADLTGDPRWRLKAAVVARQVDPAAVPIFLDPLLRPVPRSFDVAGQRVSARDVWDHLPALVTESEPELVEWRQLYGTAARVGVVPAGEPLLQPEWSLPLTDHPGVRSRIDELLRDLEDESRTTIFAAAPIAVGDRVAFRDLRGVRVVSLSTGQDVWRTVAGLSPEQVLIGQPLAEAGNNAAWRFALQRGALDDAFFGEAAEYHPLANLLFRDATLGLLSSDGERLYALEDVAVLTRSHAGYQWDADESEDPFGAVWNSSRLTAYDLATGRVRWSVGGAASDDAAAPSLANAFFLGAPVAVDDELYVVAAQGEEIRLWALDPVTGRALWSQLLAYSDTKIDVDIVRRWLSAPVAAGQGIVACPTTAGWLVAVDRTRRSLLWAYRYLPPVEDRHVDPGAQFLPQRGLNEQWFAGCPIIAGQSVVFAPPDGDDLVCLNLSNGALRWKHPRGDGLYVGGVQDGRVLVVETRGVVAYALDTGETKWRCEWDAAQRPTGRGVIGGGRFVVPLSSRELVAIELENGKIAQRWPLPDESPALGNLVKAGGRWLSLSPQGCRAFGERDQVVREIAARLNHDSQDAEALLRDAELRLLDRDFAGAEPRLRHLTGPLSDAGEARRRDAWWRVLSQRVMQDVAGSANAITELATYARTPEDRLRLAGWRADQLAASGDAWSAFRELWKVAQTDGPEDIARAEAPEVRVQRRAWLAGRLGDLWTRAAGDDRRRIDEFVRAAIDAAVGPRAERIRLAELCDFHPAAARLWWRIADDSADLDDLARAESILARGSQHADAAVAAESSLRLAKLWLQFGLTEAARPMLRDLTGASGSVGLASGDLVNTEAARLLRELPVDAAAVAGPPSLAGRSWQAQQSPTTHAPQTQSLSPPEAPPSWRGFTMQIEPLEQRVTFQSRNSERWHWLAPLKMNPRSDDPQVIPHRFVDHRLWVLSRDVLHCFSPFERKTVWTRALSDGRAAHDDRFALPQTPGTLMGPDDHGEPLTALQRQAEAHGRLAVANRNYLCVVGRRELTVIDPLTGAERWRKSGVPPLATIFGGDGVVYIFNSQREPAQAEAYRAQDGRPLEIPKLAERLSRALCLRGDDLVLLEQQRYLGLELFAGKITLRRWNPLTSADAWKLELPARSYVGLAGENLAVIVGPPSEKGAQTPRDVECVDLDSGARQRLAAAPLTTGGSGFIPLFDEDQLYLIAYAFAGPGYHYGDSLHSLPVHGRIVAWDRRTGALLWQREVNDQHLVLDRFAQSPALVFVTRSWQQQGNSSFTTLSLLALDKRSGDVLYESTAPSAFGGFHSLIVRAWEPSIELRSYNLKLKLSPAAPQ
jgi:outer membrane protein assembly factor BamB